MDYIQFLIAAQRFYTCAEATSHEAFTRLLTRQPPDTAALWQKERGFVPKYVYFDGWYSGLKNLKAGQGHG